MNSVTVHLPWPHKDLSPNARVHWSRRRLRTHKARNDARVACYAAGVRWLAWAGASVAITFHPPDKRLRDTDNMLAALKSALDGIADVTGIDDRHWQLTLTRAEPVKRGEVVVTLSPLGQTAEPAK